MIGEPIEFEFSSADASTAAPIVVRESGSFAALALAAKDRVIVTDVNFVIADAVVSVRIIADSDEDGDVDANETLFVLGPGQDSRRSHSGMSGAQGILPKIKASGAGQVDITGSGYIIRS